MLAAIARVNRNLDDNYGLTSSVREEIAGDLNEIAAYLKQAIARRSRDPRQECDADSEFTDPFADQ